MNSENKNYIIFGLIGVIAILLLVLIPKKDEQVNPEVKDFHTCADAGYPIMESFPAQCRTPDGRTFVEDINENAEVVVTSPERGALVSSPLTVTGKAKGNWFFEDNMPVTLKDTNGKVLAQKGARSVDGNWMTADYVNFTVTLEFANPETEFGVIIIEKDNPSGLPENGASYAIPVKLK